MAGGILISAFALSPILGLIQSTLLMTFLGCVATGLAFVRAASPEFPPIHEPEAEANASQSPTRILREKSREIWAAFLLLLLGGLFAWSSRFVDQLVPVTVSLVAAKWSCLLSGWAIGFWAKSRKSADQSNHQGVLPSFVLAAYGVMLAATFPLWVDLCLSMTVGVSNVFLLTLCRMALVFGIIAPLGLVWGRVSAMLFQAQSTKTPACKSIPIMGSAVLAGWLFAQWVLLPLGAPAQIVFGLCLAAMVLACMRLLLEMSLPKNWVNRFAMAGLSLLLLVSLLRVDHYQPQSSAELLFAAPVFVAHQAGVDRELLMELDEGRHVATREGQQGTYTLWKYRGVQHQLRQNGLPKGMASGDVMLCPEYSAEVLPSAMPLVLHERPDRVLILGLGSGVSISTALAFPTQEVTCVETDPVLIELVKEQIWHDRPNDPAQDPRLTILPVDPVLLLRSKSEPFDVIVSIPHQAMVAETAAYFTEAFYRDASQKLAEDGLFCQRLPFVDFGPDALRVAARTMQAVFRRCRLPRDGGRGNVAHGYEFTPRRRSRRLLGPPQKAARSQAIGPTRLGLVGPAQSVGIQ